MNNRLFFIDFLRVASAFIILFFHSILHMGCWYPYLQCFFAQGATVMTMFFLLSGFIVSAQYGNKSLMDLPSMTKFYKKKLFSIVPIYLIFYAIHVIYFSGPNSLRQNLILFPIELTMTQSWLEGLGHLSHNGGTWFISCLVFSFLSVPFLNEIFRQLTNQKRLGLIIFLSFMVIYVPIAARLLGAPNLYDNPLLRCGEFAIGMLVYPIFQLVKTAEIRTLYLKSASIVTAAILFLTITFCTLYRFGSYTEYNFICIPAFILLIVLGGNAWTHCRSKILNAIINFFNSFTYEFYLTQFFTWDITTMILKNTGIPINTLSVILVGFAVSTIIGFSFFRFISTPARKWLTSQYIK